MSTEAAPTPITRPLYTGPAGQVWADGLKLYGLSATGVRVLAVMPGGVNNQPTPAEMQAMAGAAQGAYGPLKPWMVALLLGAALLALVLLGTPAWVVALVGLLGALTLLALPAYRQYRAFEQLFGSREELTLLLSDSPVQAVSSMVDVAPDSPAQKLTAARQPVAVVVRGLPTAERVKLAGAVMRHAAVQQVMAGRQKS